MWTLAGGVFKKVRMDASLNTMKSALEASLSKQGVETLLMYEYVSFIFDKHTEPLQYRVTSFCVCFV